MRSRGLKRRRPAHRRTSGSRSDALHVEEDEPVDLADEHDLGRPGCEEPPASDLLEQPVIVPGDDEIFRMKYVSPDLHSKTVQPE
jgi:hypothetical protein